MIYLILVLGLILRLISLNQSLWLDEATTALVSKMSVFDIFHKFLPGDFHPPLYYLVIKYWVSIFGNSEIALRMPSVIFGLVTIYAIYLICIELDNKKTALIASLLMAFSGLHIYYSQEARMYSLATLLVTASFYLFIKKRWFLFSIILLLIGATDYVSLFVVPVFLIFGIRNIKKVLLSLFPLLVGFGFWYSIFIQQISAGMSVEGSTWWQILGTLNFKNVALIPVKFILGRISFDNKTVYLFVTVFVLSVFSYLLFKARSAPKIIWSWLITPIILGIIISFKIPTLSYFRFLFCLPAFCVLIAYGIQKTARYSKYFLILAMTLNLVFSLTYLLNPKFHRENWRLAADLVRDTKIVFPSANQKEALRYYKKDSQIVSIDQLHQNDREVWYSRYVWEISDPNGLVQRQMADLGYNKTSEFNFNGVVFWKYIKN